MPFPTSNFLRRVWLWWLTKRHPVVKRYTTPLTSALLSFCSSTTATMADTEAAPISFKKRSNKSTNLRKRPATPPPDNDPSASDSDYTSDDNEPSTRIKRRKKEGITTTTSSSITRPADLSKSTQYTASRSTILSTNDDATRTQHWSVSDAAAKPTQPTAESAPPTSDDAYKGTSTYSTFITKNPNAPTRAVGPVKAAPGNVRTITVTDFAPDVCKDYKQTGFCGFGDNCKFLHAREDYKQGWQLDKEWESAGKKKKDGKGEQEKDTATEEEKMLQDIPFVCIICKEDYKKPVVTKCGHYFCEKCAMGRYLKEKKKGCANCGADTGGSFGVAKKLNGLLERKKRRLAEKERGEGENGGEDEE